jgi:preprotein translocase subunit SecF
MNVVRFRRWFFIFSGVLLVAALVTLITPPSLKPGIDFTGGTAITAKFVQPQKTEEVRNVLLNIGHTNASVQAMDDDSFFIRVGELTQDAVDPGDDLTKSVRGGRAELENALSTLGTVEIIGLDVVSGIIGAENVRNAVIAIVVASGMILLYITWAFRRVPSPFRYGVAAIVALVHDVIIVLGVFSLLGKVIDLEVNVMFITGVLTVIGYSVNDTIVVFDRLRENVGRYNGSPLIDLVNLSIRETVGRSLNTSLTLLIVVMALLLFGGPTIQPLLLVLLVGVIVGTYSSIFVATLFLVAWETGGLSKIGRLLILRRG